MWDDGKHKLLPWGHPAIVDAHYYRQSPDPGKSYRGLTRDDSHYYGLSLLRNYRHFLGTKVTILLVWLSIEQTSCTSHITLLCKNNYSLLFIICKNTFQKISGMFIFTLIPWIVCTIILTSSLELALFSSQLFRRAQALTYHSQQMLSSCSTVDKFIQSWKIFWVSTLTHI